MIHVLFGIVSAVSLVLAVSYVSSRSRRVKRAPGATVVPPARPRTARGMAVPVQTRMTGPYAYDNGVLTGRPDEEDGS
jgi:hypothetical protein